MWKQKIKKALATLCIIVLLPYIVTVFLHGPAEETSENTLDTYCIARLAKEVSEDYEDEMLKAQAVIVRTTVYKEVQEKEGVFSEQEAHGEEELPDVWYQKLKEIWESTEGQVLMYEDKLALVPFHQLSNGMTRVGKEVLGSEEYPYLQSVACPKDIESELQISSKLISAEDAKIVKTDSAGYVTEVQMGGETCSGEQFRDTYELASGCFTLQDADGKIRVTTSGIGHGLGLSQNTANEMAKEGKTHEEILAYFFQNTKIQEVAEVLLKTE